MAQPRHVGAHRRLLTAVLFGLRSLEEFGAVESWSGYFVATDPTGRTRAS
jgi:hypothetical protein